MPTAVRSTWVKDRDPELYGEILAAIGAGQWVPVGGTWIEPDCNLPAGESLVRQFLYGQRFFERELGGRASEFWNPDVFGYAGQLPQIMRGAGITRFVTQKLSWNRFTSPMFHTFSWEGLDGTRVTTHFPPADDYGVAASVADLRRSARAYKDHDRSRHGLLLFGHDDGGGGPTPEMLETSIREVYVEAERQLSAVAARARELIAAAARRLVDDGDGAVAFNTTSSSRAEVAELPGGGLVFVQAPSYGAGRLARAPDVVHLERHEDGFTLRNGRLIVSLAADGSVTSLVLRDGEREALAAPGNRFELYDDRPLEWDAWDVDPFHLETGRSCAGARSARVVLDDPLRAEVVFEHPIGVASELTQTVRLDAGAGRLEFHTEVQWRERHRMLKVTFPLLVRSERANYEMPFGHAERPTHFSTAADLARYEVPAHRWGDLSEHGAATASPTRCSRTAEAGARAAWSPRRGHSTSR